MSQLEESHNPKRVEEDRSIAIEAAIVRIMKVLSYFVRPCLQFAVRTVCTLFAFIGRSQYICFLRLQFCSHLICIFSTITPTTQSNTTQHNTTGAPDSSTPAAGGRGALAAGLLPPRSQGHQATHRGPHRPRIPGEGPEQPEHLQVHGLIVCAGALLIRLSVRVSKN
jgi:hypothetical protein